MDMLQTQSVYITNSSSHHTQSNSQEALLGPALSMEDLLVSMSAHLTTGDGRGQGTSGGGLMTSGPSPRCSSPIVALPPPIPHHPDGGVDGQFNASDLPLPNGFHDEDSEVKEINGGHPRLQSSFYTKLREKYPRAFQRRSSITSDTTSVYSEFGSRPASRTMSPMPKGHLISTPTPEGHGSSYSEGGGPSGSEGNGPLREGLPPRAPINSRRITTNSEFHQKKVSVSRTVTEDLTISGSVPTKRKPDLLINPNLDHSLSTYQIQGLLQQDLNRTLTPEPDSNKSLSLKERLHKNKATLRALLSEENNPLRKRRLCTPTNFNKSFESDITLESDLNSTLENNNNKILQTYPNRNGLLQIQTISEEKIAIANSRTNHLPQDLRHPPMSSSDELQQKSPQSQPQMQYNGVKYYNSPDSSHDSAVDMDTASLQSSPGSSDTQLTVIPRSNHTQGNQRHHSNHTAPGGSTQNHRPGDVRGGSQNGHHDYHLSTAGANRDSDVDSGIAPGPSSGWTYRRSRDQVDSSSSSTENEPELEHLYTANRVQNGQRLGALSPQEIRTASRSRQQQGTSTAKHGPLRADHTIQRPTADHQNRHEPQSNPRLHPDHSRKSASTLDLSQDRSSRVRFEDESSNGNQPLSQHQRAMSQPELSRGPMGEATQPELPPEVSSIPSGCRARKLRGARKSVENLSPGSGMQDGGPAQPDSLSNQQHSPSNQQLLSNQQYPHSNQQQPLSNQQHPPSNQQQAHSNQQDPHSNQQQPLRNKQRPLSNQQQTLSKGARMGLPPSGKPEDLKTRMQRLRSRSMSPDQILHTASPVSEVPMSATLPVNRLNHLIEHSPPIVPYPEDTQSYLSGTLSSEDDLHNEVAQFNGFNDAWTNALSVKKSKKPWKKNKGKYNPSDSTELFKSELASKPKVAPRPSSGLSDRYSEVTYSKGWSKNGLQERPSSCTAEMSSPRARTEGHQKLCRQNTYEEVGNVQEGHQPDENPYDEVQFNQSQEAADQGGDLYSVPHKPPKPRSNRPSVTSHDDSISQEEAPPVPDRGYTSNLEKYKDLSGSRSSLSGKMDSFRKAAKTKWSALRRAVSLERVDKPAIEEPEGGTMLRKSPSLQSLTKRFSLKKKDKTRSEDTEGSVPPSPNPSQRSSFRSSFSLGRAKRSGSMISLPTSVDSPQNFRPIGKLKQLNRDGTQILELVRPPHGPFGFYIARGNVNYGGGVFVSRLSDGLPEHFFAGLLGVGDEILEINCQLVTNLTLDEVYAMMAQRHHLLIKTLPYAARKDT